MTIFISDVLIDLFCDLDFKENTNIYNYWYPTNFFKAAINYLKRSRFLTVSNCPSGNSRLKISVESTLLLFQLSFSYENKLKFVNFDVVISLALARLTPLMTSEFKEHGYPISSLIMSKNVSLKVKVRD